MFILLYILEKSMKFIVLSLAYLFCVILSAQIFNSGLPYIGIVLFILSTGLTGFLLQRGFNK